MTRDCSEAPGGGRSEIDSLLGYLAVCRHTADTRLIKRACETAAHWHRGQFRKSGDPYLTHPAAVAMILARAGADDPSLCAALLHDVVEDTACSLDVVCSEFGPEIADLVAAVTGPLPVRFTENISVEDIASI